MSTFKKEILDQFEQLFLKFALSKYDFQPIDPTQTTPGVSDTNLVYQNFQLLMIDMMKPMQSMVGAYDVGTGRGNKVNKLAELVGIGVCCANCSNQLALTYRLPAGHFLAVEV